MMLEGSIGPVDRILRSLVILLILGSATPLAASTAVQAQEGPAGGPATALVVFGTEEESDTIWAEVARTEDERAKGLMFREELGENAGMLFVLPEYQEISLWMKDTYIPLDVAFMDPTFRVTGIRSMEPESQRLVSSPGRVQFALEVNQGWFEEHGVRADDRARVVFGN